MKKLFLIAFLSFSFALSAQEDYGYFSIHFLNVPQENVSVPGIYYYVFQKLSWDGINISQVISTSNEFTILVSEDEVDNAFSVINKLKNI